jgi:23S rRNA (pseudouridine1915-N3)-methyltransferase
MRWVIVALGKMKDQGLAPSVREFLKRLAPYRPVELIELPDERLVAGQEGAARRKEAERILTTLHPDAYVIALWEQGEQLTSVVLAERLQRLEHASHKEIAFVIGGAEGLDPVVLQRANWTLGLSRLTLPHQFARLFLLEQLYRCERIRRNEPYHK